MSTDNRGQTTINAAGMSGKLLFWAKRMAVEATTWKSAAIPVSGG
jgi:hypothetical protein